MPAAEDIPSKKSVNHNGLKCLNSDRMFYVLFIGMMSPPAYSPFNTGAKTPYLWSPGYGPVDGTSPARRQRSPFARPNS